MSDISKPSIPISSTPLKIPYDSLTLRGVVAELRLLLIGGQIQEIRQPSATDITLGVRNLNRNQILLLSADAQFARAHLTLRRRVNPPAPPNFCMILRKYLENTWVRDVRQRGFDRILEIEAGSRDTEDDTPTFTLVIELMGKHSNLILVNSEGTILDSVKRITRRVNRVREVLPGLPYQPPPTQADKVDPLVSDAIPFLMKELGTNSESDRQTSSEQFIERFTDTLLLLYIGISPFLAREMAARLRLHLSSDTNFPSPTAPMQISDSDTKQIGPLPPFHPNALRAALEQVWDETLRSGGMQTGMQAGTPSNKLIIQPVLLRDAEQHPLGGYPLPLLQAPANRQSAVASLNAALDDAFSFQIDRAGFLAVMGELRGQLQQEVKRAERQQQSVARTLAEAERSELYKQTGELLLANLWRIEHGSRQVVVQDYYDPAFPDRAIELDPRLNAQENAESYFRRYRKTRDAEERALEEDTRLKERLTELTVATAALNHAQTEQELRALRTDLLARHVMRPASESSERERNNAEPEFAGHKIRRYTTPQGFEILVGENATSNDYLTTRIAAPNDWWLHVRAAVSSHVVVRAHGKPYEVPRTVLERAAMLCALHSQQKHSSLVSVDYTLKKYVRKPRGSAAGAADYQNELTIDITP